MLRTRAPVATRVLLHCDAPRLACVKPVASVHPEPGSNSSLYNFYIDVKPIYLKKKSDTLLRELTSFFLLYYYLYIKITELVLQFLSTKIFQRTLSFIA